MSKLSKQLIIGFVTINLLLLAVLGSMVFHSYQYQERVEEFLGDYRNETNENVHFEYPFPISLYLKEDYPIVNTEFFDICGADHPLPYAPAKENADGSKTALCGFNVEKMSEVRFCISLGMDGGDIGTIECSDVTLINELLEEG